MTPTPQRHRPIGLARGTRTGGAVLSSEDLGREYCAIYETKAGEAVRVRVVIGAVVHLLRGLLHE